MKPLWKKKISHWSQTLRSAHFLLSQAVSPKSRQEDHERQEFILNIILIASIIMSALFLSIVGWHVWQSYRLHVQYGGISLVHMTGLLLFCLILYDLSRLGYFRFSAYVLTGIFFALSGYAMFRWGVDLPSALLGFVLVLVMAGVLLGTRSAVVAGAGMSLFIIILNYAQVKGLLKTNESWKFSPSTVNDGYEFGVIYAIIVVLIWLSNREIVKSLRRARRSEQALRKERDTLEIRIEERTKALKKVQSEQVRDLHIFAEFGKMTSGFFHDLINPLTGLHLHIEKLQDNTCSDREELQRHVDGAAKAAYRLEHFVRGIQKQIKNQDTSSYFSLTDEILQAIEIMGYKARKKQVDLVFDPECVVFTWGDAIKFHQIIVNLISNAIDAYDGVLSDEKQVVITLKKEGQIVEVGVADFGTGIPASIISRIFDPLFTTKDTRSGTGLGLFRTKDLVEKYFKGSLAVRTAAAKGTTFIFIFSLLPQP